MLVNVFKSSQKPYSIIIIIFSILLWVPSFWVDQNQVLNISVLPFYLSNKMMIYLIASLLIAFQALYLTYIVNEFKLLSSSTHLPALLFVILNAGFLSLLVFSPLLIVNTLLLIVLHQLLSVYNQNNAGAFAFNIGFLLAICTLLYFPLILIFPLLWFTLLYTKPSNWRELLISILGYLVPIAFYVSYYFLTDQLMHLITIGWDGYRIFKPEAYPVTTLERSFFIGLLLIGAFAGFGFLKGLSHHIVKVKKHLVIVILLLLLLFSTLFLNSLDYLTTYILLIIPLTIIIANFFNNLKKKWLAELVFALLLIAIVVGYFS